MRPIDANRLIIILNNILENATSNSMIDVFRREICKLFLEVINEQPTIPAIPVEWLRNVEVVAEMSIDDRMFIEWLITKWQKEQEA